MNILGLNAYHPESSACLIKDGQLIAAAEEERFLRVKHWAGFPKKSIEFCLEKGSVSLEELDFIAINRSPQRYFFKKLLFVLKNRPHFLFVKDRFLNMLEVENLSLTLAREFSIPSFKITAPIVQVEHHLAHLASAFFACAFKNSAIVSIDGFGDFVSCMIAGGLDNRIEVFSKIFYPHSLGIFYTAFTQFLGFKNFGDEYKMMGLAAYGRPKFLKELERIIQLRPKGSFQLDLRFFSFYKKPKKMLWKNTVPLVEELYSEHLFDLFGQPRNPQDKIDSFHCDLAASVQAMYEKVFFHILRYAYDITNSESLCLAGGCALNSVANGKILDCSPFKKVFIQPASSDAGGALGAGLYLYCNILRKERNFVLEHPFWGPEYTEEEILSVLREYAEQLSSIKVERFLNFEDLISRAACSLAEGKIVGWFQGRMEIGPRALGNRSILADPRRPQMKDILNSRVKRREEFRPFAPAVLEEKAFEFFKNGYLDSFMLSVVLVKEDKREIIPAVTHVDGTARVQIVSKKNNFLFWQLIKEFEKITGVPVLLNTSFNENEPIVCTPQEALECFLRTKMDVLVMGKTFLNKQN